MRKWHSDIYDTFDAQFRVSELSLMSRFCACISVVNSLKNNFT